MKKTIALFTILLLIFGTTIAQNNYLGKQQKRLSYGGSLVPTLSSLYSFGYNLMPNFRAGAEINYLIAQKFVLQCGIWGGKITGRYLEERTHGTNTIDMQQNILNIPFSLKWIPRNEKGKIRPFLGFGVMPTWTLMSRWSYLNYNHIYTSNGSSCSPYIGISSGVMYGIKKIDLVVEPQFWYLPFGVFSSLGGKKTFDIMLKFSVFYRR